MDRLHEHLDKVADHAAQVHAAATDAAAAADAQSQQERQNSVSDSLTTERG